MARVVVDGGSGDKPRPDVDSQDGRSGGQRRMLIQRGRAVVVSAPAAPDAGLPGEADVAEEGAEADLARALADDVPRPAVEALREVAVRDLETERAGRVFPCMRDDRYIGCVGYDQCKVLCWSPRPREREALMRVEKPTGGPCRDCVYAREVYGEVAVLNNRQVRLMECRLGYWHGRAAVSEFVENKIALNVALPCPGFEETDWPHPAVEQRRATARRRKLSADPQMVSLEALLDWEEAAEEWWDEEEDDQDW